MKSILIMKSILCVVIAACPALAFGQQACSQVFVLSRDFLVRDIQNNFEILEKIEKSDGAREVKNSLANQIHYQIKDLLALQGDKVDVILDEYGHSQVLISPDLKGGPFNRAAAGLKEKLKVPHVTFDASFQLIANGMFSSTSYTKQLLISLRDILSGKPNASFAHEARHAHFTGLAEKGINSKYHTQFQMFRTDFVPNQEKNGYGEYFQAEEISNFGIQVSYLARTMLKDSIKIEQNKDYEYFKNSVRNGYFVSSTAAKILSYRNKSGLLFEREDKAPDFKFTSSPFGGSIFVSTAKGGIGITKSKSYDGPQKEAVEFMIGEAGAGVLTKVRAYDDATINSFNSFVDKFQIEGFKEVASNSPEWKKMSEFLNKQFSSLLETALRHEKIYQLVQEKINSGDAFEASQIALKLSGESR